MATCAATEPVAPAAPDTTTVSPGCAFPTSSMPKYAVIPVAPSTPLIWRMGSPAGTTFAVASGPHTECSCHPSSPVTIEPTGTSAARDSTTSPIAPERITSPMPTGGR